MTSLRVVIVGASIGGVSCAEALRAEGFGGAITVLGDEAAPPYNRPPLSKQVLTGDWSGDEAQILPTSDLAALDVELRLGVRATGLDVRARRIELDRGDSIQYDTLVIATGVRPRKLAGVRRLPGVHELRTLDDAADLRGALGEGTRVVVVGSGILGSEIAAAATKLGSEVVLIGRSDRLRLGQVGDRLSDRLAALHRRGGVRVISGSDVEAVLGDDRVEAVALADGTTLPADVVVTAVGCLPAVEWLASSGLDIADGVICDEHGLAAAGVYAVGDVAAWRDESTGVARRAEHQLNAIEQAQAVALTIASGKPSARPLPFFWSELFGARIQAYGTFASGGPLTLVAGDDSTGTAADRFVAESLAPDGTSVGVVGWNSPRDFRIARARVGSIPASSPPELVGTSKGPLS